MTNRARVNRVAGFLLLGLTCVLVQPAAVQSADSAADAPAKAGEERRASATSLAGTGWRLIRSGDYHHAALAFAEASALAPSEASFLVGLGVSQHLLVKDELAAATLHRALALDPGLSQAHKILGDISDQRGEIDTAVRHYEIAFEQDPNDATVKDRLSAARRAAQAEAGLDRLFSAHFVVKFRRATDRAAANAIADRLESVYKTIGRQFSYFPADRIVVVLYPQEQFQSAAGGPGWARGLFDGRIHLPAETLSDSAAADAALRHEYTHVVVHRLSSGQAPTWLHEGLALYIGNGTDVAGLWDREIHRLRTGERPPLAALHRGFTELPPRDASLVYAESYGATHALIQRHGMARVRRLLEAVSVMPDFSEAFEMVMHERYSDFDAAWVTAHTGKRF